MDMNTALVIIIALFVVAAVGVYIVYRNKVKVKIKGPFGTRFVVTGESAQEPAKPKQEQRMKSSEKGEQEMHGSGADQKQTMEDSKGGKQKMS